MTLAFPSHYLKKGRNELERAISIYAILEEINNKMIFTSVVWLASDCSTSVHYRKDEELEKKMRKDIENATAALKVAERKYKKMTGDNKANLDRIISKWWGDVSGVPEEIENLRKKVEYLSSDGYKEAMEMVEKQK